MEKFTGCKVFSATKALERQELGGHIAEWLSLHPELEVVDRIVLQSSDAQFHCLSIVMFYRQRKKV